MMKKLRTTCAAVVVATLSFVAGPTKSETVLKLGTIAFPGIPMGDALETGLVENLAEVSGGKLTIEPHYRASLCGEQKCGEQANQGLLAIWTSSTANFGSFGTALSIFDLPFLFENQDVADKITEGWLGEMQCEIASQTTQHVCFEIMATGGFRHIGNSRRVVKHPDDLKGIKMRVTKSPVEYTLMKSWGAVPVPYDWTQLYQGLQTGVVEGQYVGVPWQRLAKLHEVTKYYTEVGGVWNAIQIGMDKRQYDKLTEQEKAWLREAMSNFGEVMRRTDQEWTEQEVGKIKDEVIEWYKPNAEELAAWQEGAVDAWLNAKGTYDPAIAERVLAEQGRDEFIALLKEAGAL